MALVRVNRKVKAGKHAILDVFPGLDRSAAFRGIFPDGLREQVLHELTHIRQWHAGRELWDRRYNYVDRPTEIEAYRVAVDEARSLGMTDREIADYLRVEWTSREEHERLCKHLGVRSPESRAV